MYLNPRYLSVREEVSNGGQQSYLRKELQLSGWEFCRGGGSQQALSSGAQFLSGELIRLPDT
jgi:hypothetical protein